MSFFDILKTRKLTGNDEPVSVESLLAELDADLSEARSALAGVQATYGEIALTAGATGLAQADDRIAELTTDIKRKEAARTALQARLQVARDREAAASLAARWAACEAALERRHAVMAEVDDLTSRLAAAILEAEEVAGDAWVATAACEFKLPNGRPLQLSPEFTDVRNAGMSAVWRHLAAVTGAEPPASFEQRSREAGDFLLNLRGRC